MDVGSLRDEDVMIAASRVLYRSLELVFRRPWPLLANMAEAAHNIMMRPIIPRTLPNHPPPSVRAHAYFFALDPCFSPFL